MDSARYFSFTAALIFLAVCAYSAAALYSRVERPEIETVSLLHLQESAQLQGIVLRREQGLSFGWGTRLLAEDSRRLAAGETMAVDLMGRELLSPCSAVFFESSDGFEDLDPRDIDAEDVSALESLLDRKAGDKADARLVTDTAWYYWALCSSKDHLPGSGLCSVQFQGMEESVQAQIISLSETEGGKRAVLLRLTQGGSEYLSLRKTDAKLLFSQHSGLYLPEEAIRQEPDGSKFVYILSSGIAEKQPVEIIYTGSSFSLAAADFAPGSLAVGDRVILGKDIYEGKVLT